MTQSIFDLHRSETSPILNGTIISSAGGSTPGFLGPAFTAATVGLWMGMLKEQGCNFRYVRWLITWAPGTHGIVQLVSMPSGGPGSSDAVTQLKVAATFDLRDYHNPRVDGADVTQTFREDMASGVAVKYYAMRMCGDTAFPMWSSVLEVVWGASELEYVKRSTDAMVSRIAAAAAATSYPYQG